MAHDPPVPDDLAHAYPVADPPRQAQFLGVLALVLMVFLLIGAATGLLIAITAR